MNVHKLRPDIIDPTGQRSFPGIAIETKMIIDYVCEQQTAGTLRFPRADIEQLIGRQIDGNRQGYRYLAAARRILLRDKGILIDIDKHGDIFVCSDEQKMLVADRDRKRAYRANLRSKQKLASVNYDNLSPDKKREWNARMSIVGALELMGRPKAAEKVERMIEQAVLPSAKVLEIFKA